VIHSCGAQQRDAGRQNFLCSVSSPHFPGLQIGWAGLIVLLAVPALAGALVPIPGGIGIREASGVAIAAWLGIDPAVAGAILVWHRAVTLLGLRG
jgi:uncharacterized membrane protein YbhN (UPF0104 family)